MLHIFVFFHIKKPEQITKERDVVLFENRCISYGTNNEIKNIISVIYDLPEKGQEVEQVEVVELEKMHFNHDKNVDEQLKDENEETS